MEEYNLETTLQGLVGHLVIETKEDQTNFERLSKSLVNAAIPADALQVKTANFSFEKADLYFPERINSTRMDAIQLLAKRNREREKGPDYRVFVREVPVRDQFVAGSMPAWAAGARVDHTVGPFRNVDGRQFWFDFFPIETLIALYIQGIADPVLLFDVKQARDGVISPNARLGIGLLRSYNLSKGSIWIMSRFLAPNAPAGAYTGLTIDGGKVTLSAAPQNINNKLTISANTTVTLQLKLNQPDAVDPDPASAYGVDARNMDLKLPKSLNFHFSGQGRTIDDVDKSAWRLYGQKVAFDWNSQQQTTYNLQYQRILFPCTPSESEININDCESVLNRLAGSAPIDAAAWALPVATIDITQPTAASGIGGLLVKGKDGLSDTWKGLSGGGLNLSAPVFLVEPGQIVLADFQAANPHATQEFDLWKDELNEFGTQVNLQFAKTAPFFYASNANGNELLMALTDADFRVDRPVKVTGKPPAVKSVNSLLVIAANNNGSLIYLYDDNLLQDAASANPNNPAPLEKMALAMTNALFKVTPPTGCLLFGSLSADYTKVEKGFLFLTFGLYAYLPTLPDPYAANLGILKRQIRGGTRAEGAAYLNNSPITALLVCLVQWDPPADESGLDQVVVSFHFAPLATQFAGVELGQGRATAVTPGTASTTVTHLDSVSMLSNLTHLDATVRTTRAATTGARASAAVAGSNREPLPDYDEAWTAVTSRFTTDMFSLLDVSTNADLFGISFDIFSLRNRATTVGTTDVTHGTTVNTGNTGTTTTQDSQFPIQVVGMDVVSKGINVKAFTVPQISWEPLINLTPPAVSGDPPAGFNYYPNDGGPMRIMNTGQDNVALAPLPLTKYLLDNFELDTPNFLALSILTLPFGLRALAFLQNTYVYSDNTGTYTRKGTDVVLNSEAFEAEIRGALQLQLNAGEAFIQGESDMFVGSTIQVNNVLDAFGSDNGDSTLGRTVTEIFNNEFMLVPFNLVRQRGVPLTRIDLSGYGASSFSNWLNPTAAFAETSQAKFDILVGRCAHEIIQVVSIIYPWGIKVVRTITIFRVGSGFVYRFDSGWRAESDGKFDFRYFVNLTPTNKVEQPSPFEVHPGIVKGLFNVQNIVETDEIAISSGNMVSAKMVDENGLYVDNPAAGDLLGFKLQPVYFDADIEIEGAISGFKTKKIHNVDKNVVPSRKIIGYVQVAPRGIPISKETLRDLVIVQLGSIGGPIDCEVVLANSAQKMRLNRFDFNNSFGANGSDIVFSVAGRGNVLLPKDGSWTMVKHDRGTGDVTPVDANQSVPVIRPGKLIKNGNDVKVDTPIKDVLLRIANPTELLRQAVDDTINFGVLQSTDTQKALFLTPSFELNKKKLFSKTAPLYADAFRIVNSKGIFPNIGNGDTDLGDAITLIKNGTEFAQGLLQDAGKAVWELMDVSDVVNNVAEQGFNLLNEAFDLPDAEFELIDLGDGNFRIYIEYVGKQNGNPVKGDLNFSINSAANQLADTWKSKMSNIGLVVDLAGIDRLVTIRGKWDSKKGSEASYPQPDLEFAPELQPVIDILEILQQLQTGDYAGAIGNGLKLAMSNKAGSWEYKFEASKEIPVLRFPVPDAVYNDPNCPFKLEAGFKIGAYFNAALKVTTNANELLPSAGGLLGFYGRLSVMCVSLSAATIYAIGQVNLDIAADTKIGPSLRMKFGFGAQIVVGLPVAGNVSVLFMVGVEIFAASGIIEVTAFMLFEGHAEILGGIVSITIRIEAKGTVSKKAIGGGDSRTDLACQVTFGIDISIFLVINISFSTSWQEQRQIA
ncbi:MAG TPA: hypothetical protein PKB07_01990 [Flavilitoribacter sp.]|nr:hypothetical protein [Flavilitoribacter sp.]